MAVLVVYYSLTGYTEAFASGVAKTLGADIIRVEENKKRTGVIGFISACFDAIFSRKSVLKGIDYDTTKYNLIFIATPVWAGKPTPAINTYITNAILKDKKVVLLITMGSGGGEKTSAILVAKIKSRGGEVINTFMTKTAGRKQSDVFKDGVEIGEVYRKII
jgi:flavodoxin